MLMDLKLSSKCACGHASNPCDGNTVTQIILYGIHADDVPSASDLHTSCALKSHNISHSDVIRMSSTHCQIGVNVV